MKKDVIKLTPDAPKKANKDNAYPVRALRMSNRVYQMLGEVAVHEGFTKGSGEPNKTRALDHIIRVKYEEQKGEGKL